MLSYPEHKFSALLRAGNDREFGSRKYGESGTLVPYLSLHK
jgi:hypothetical protein